MSQCRFIMRICDEDDDDVTGWAVSSFCLSFTLSLISVRPNADFRQDKRTRCCCKMQFCNVIRFAAAIRFVFLIFFRCCSFLPLSFVSLSSRLIYLTVRDYKTLVYPPYFVYHFSAQSYALSLSLSPLTRVAHSFTEASTASFHFISLANGLMQKINNHIVANIAKAETPAASLWLS